MLAQDFDHVSESTDDGNPLPLAVVPHDAQTVASQSHWFQSCQWVRVTLLVRYDKKRASSRLHTQVLPVLMLREQCAQCFGLGRCVCGFSHVSGQSAGDSR